MTEQTHDSQLEQEIAQVELTIEEGKKLVEKGAAIRRLSQNKDFQNIIEDGFFKDEALRLLGMSNAIELNADIRACIKVDMHAPATLRRYLSATVQRADAMEREIADHKDTLETLHEENSGAVAYSEDDGEEV